jgi:hypothetical protein
MELIADSKAFSHQRLLVRIPLEIINRLQHAQIDPGQGRGQVKQGTHLGNIKTKICLEINNLSHRLI